MYEEEGVLGNVALLHCIASRKGGIQMRRIRTVASLVVFAFAVSFLIAAAQPAQAQITEQIDASIHHPFTVADTTLPPGQYVFRMISQYNQSAMLVTNKSGKESAEFLVRDSRASHTPNHTKLVFERYGNKEYLTHIYEVGSKDGVAIVDLSHTAYQLGKQG